MLKMWEILKPFDFTATHGVFIGTDVRDAAEVKVKGRVLESMKIQTRAQGWSEQNAPILWEEWP